MTMEPSAKGLAERLLSRATGESHDPIELAEEADRVYLTLRELFVPFIGPLGFRAVFTLALNLSQREHSALSGIGSIPEDGATLQGLPESLQGLSYAQATDAAQALIANIFRVLVELVGWDFVLRIVSPAWPGISTGFRSSPPTDGNNKG